MNLLLRFVTIGILSVLVFGFGSTHDVWACSGGRTFPLEEQLEYTKVIVRGYIVEVDDYRSNAIMRVREYLKGEGAEYILLALDNPTNILFRAIRNSGGGCPTHIRRMNIGDEIIILLNKQINGSYNFGVNNDYFTDEHPINYSLANNNIMSLDELGHAIEELTGEPSKQPIPDMPYPLLAPLLITTALGSNYLLPIDSSEPILLNEVQIIDRNFGIPRHLYSCWEINCRAWSPSGLDSAFIREERVIEVFYHHIVSGEGVLFPPIHELVTIWNSTSTNVNISLYRFTLFPDDPFEPVAKAELNTNIVYPNSGAWSPNGRLLAFADTDGIYLWDIFTEGAQPELLVATDIKTLQGFSPLGTYLVIGDGENGFTIDLINKNIYPAGVFSPDESAMITYGDFRQIHFRPYKNEGHRAFLPIHEVHWINDRMWVLVTCEDISIRESCNLVHGGFRGLSPSTRNGQMFSYNSITKTSVIVLDNFQIALNKNSIDNLSSYFDSVSDLSPYLDSPISSIEWLPSLFYYNP